MEVFIKSACAISPQATFDSNNLSAAPVVTPGNRLRCIEPDYKEYIDANSRRRMSRIIKMGVAAALRCNKDAGIENPDAIITATGLGCLTDTEVFMKSILENNESLSSPTAFIQSTFNTIGAQIALMQKNHNYNFTYVHRGFSFESALLDAMMQIADNESKNVLIGGFDELTDTSFGMMQRMGFWKGANTDNSQLIGSKTRGTIAGEGSVFLMLSQNDGFAKISDLATFYKPSGNEEVKNKIEQFLTKNNLQVFDIDLVILGNNGDYKQDEAYRFVQNNILKGLPTLSFKQLCGEYQTASAFAVWMAANILKNNNLPEVLSLSQTVNVSTSIRKVLIYNHYSNINHSLYLLTK